MVGSEKASYASACIRLTELCSIKELRRFLSEFIKGYLIRKGTIGVFPVALNCFIQACSKRY
jgi:hypothetical protein